MKKNNNQKQTVENKSKNQSPRMSAKKRAQIERALKREERMEEARAKKQQKKEQRGSLFKRIANIGIKPEYNPVDVRKIKASNVISLIMIFLNLIFGAVLIATHAQIVGFLFFAVAVLFGISYLLNFGGVHFVARLLTAVLGSISVYFIGSLIFHNEINEYVYPVKMLLFTFSIAPFIVFDSREFGTMIISLGITIGFLLTFDIANEQMNASNLYLDIKSNFKLIEFITLAMGAVAVTAGFVYYQNLLSTIEKKFATITETNTKLKTQMVNQENEVQQLHLEVKETESRIQQRNIEIQEKVLKIREFEKKVKTLEDEITEKTKTINKTSISNTSTEEFVAKITDLEAEITKLRKDNKHLKDDSVFKEQYNQLLETIKNSDLLVQTFTFDNHYDASTIKIIDENLSSSNTFGELLNKSSDDISAQIPGISDFFKEIANVIRTGNATNFSFETEDNHVLNFYVSKFPDGNAWAIVFKTEKIDQSAEVSPETTQEINTLKSQIETLTNELNEEKSKTIIPENTNSSQDALLSTELAKLFQSSSAQEGELDKALELFSNALLQQAEVSAIRSWSFNEYLTKLTNKSNFNKEGKKELSNDLNIDDFKPFFNEIKKGQEVIVNQNDEGEISQAVINSYFTKNNSKSACFLPILEDNDIVGMLSIESQEETMPTFSIHDKQLISAFVSFAFTNYHYNQVLKKLNQARALINAGVDTTSDGMLVVDINGEITLYNDNFLQLWQIDRSFMQTSSAQEIVEFMLEKVKFPVNPYMRYQGLRPDLDVIESLELTNGIMLQSVAIPQRHGSETVGYLWRFQPLEKSIENKEPTISKESVIKIMEASPVPMILIKEQDDCIVYGNHAFEGMVKSTQNEFIKRNLMEYFAENSDYMQLITKVEQKTHLENYPVVLKSSDESIINASITVDTITLGQMVYFVAGFVTEKTTEIASSETTAIQSDTNLDYQKLIDELDYLILETNDNKEIITWNSFAEKMLKINEKTADGPKNITQIFPENIASQLQESLENSAENNLPESLEAELLEHKYSFKIMPNVNDENTNTYLIIGKEQLEIAKIQSTNQELELQLQMAQTSLSDAQMQMMEMLEFQSDLEEKEQEILWYQNRITELEQELANATPTEDSTDDSILEELQNTLNLQEERLAELSSIKRELRQAKNQHTEAKIRVQELEQLLENPELEQKKGLEEVKNLDEVLAQVQSLSAQNNNLSKFKALAKIMAGFIIDMEKPINKLNISEDTIINNLPNALRELPNIYQNMKAENNALINKMIERSLEEPQVGDIEKYKGELIQTLSNANIQNPVTIAEKLIKIKVFDRLNEVLPILEEKNADKILDLVYNISELNNGLKLLNLNIQQTTNIMNTLESIAVAYAPAKEGQINIGTQLHDIIAEFRNRYNDKAEFILDSNELPEIHAYGEELGQLWYNLLENAVEAGNKINISSGIDNKFVFVKVTDNGAGINKEQISSIFKPFYTTKDTEYHPGLGLEICRHIVEKHRGKITVSSKPGKTTFGIYLPL